MDAPAAAPVEEPAFEVWATNWPALVTFLACQTQWKTVATMVGVFRQGLDYSALEIVLRRFGFGDAVFWDVQTMEREALDAFNEVD